MNEYWEVEAATDAAFKAAKRAANELSNPEEVQRIIRQQEGAVRQMSPSICLQFTLYPMRLTMNATR